MLTAVIDEDKCIGCSRCIPACPVDAIIGTNKFMHTVLTDECIGCKLCVKPCPMDCIDIIPLTQKIDKYYRAKQAKLRYTNKMLRLQKQAQPKLPVYTSQEQRSKTIKSNIQAALKRVKEKNKRYGQLDC